jgi:15-cis-phytoene synthase
MRPSWLEPGFATPADLAACRAMLRGGSRTFFAASLVLPRRVREPASALYGFCRQADDAIDGAGGRPAALAQLRERLGRAYEGRPLPVAADRALADVVTRFAIPRALPEALLEGFEWDSANRRYEDLPSLYAYAARVAGTVGAMMAMLMGARAPDVVARACDLGVAMQLSNIARDVGEDARMGRLYLPRQWLRDVGIDPEAWLARPVHSEALGGVIRRLLQAADQLYERAGTGIAQLPRNCRPGIRLARHLYAEIGREVERRACDSVSRRAVVSSGRKAWLAARTLVAPGRAAPAERAAPLDEVRFLVDAVAAAPAWPSGPTAPEAGGSTRWSLDEQLAWLIELFDRLERREQLRRTES